MTERQIDRIEKAEAAAHDLRKEAAQIRLELDSAKTNDPGQMGELLEAIEGLEKEAERLEGALREWRKDIH